MNWIGSNQTVVIFNWFVQEIAGLALAFKQLPQLKLSIYICDNSDPGMAR